MPGLMYERMDETGFDFAVVYPTYGLHIAHIPGDEARRGLCRLFNEMVAEDYAPYRDRLSPVGGASVVDAGGGHRGARARGVVGT